MHDGLGRAVLLAASVVVPVSGEAGSPPLALHPENPRYFLWRSRPTIVITSGEHYGAILNLDFDYRKYLDTLAREGMNGTRTFAGTYVETGGDFSIAGNTLDPAPGRFISPWARSRMPGYADGGNKFDLAEWDSAFFDRLRDFLSHASEGGVIVELTLFCPLYEESMWRVSPMNPANNINRLGPSVRDDVLTLDRSGGLLPVQEALARRMVEAVAGFDNVILEICNEPYVKNVPKDWQRHLATVVQQAVARLPAPVLISQNIANYAERVTAPHPAVSVFNFHYATPPDAVAWNAHLGKVIGDNETGFRGVEDAPYRMEAWEFILAGGGLFNHLDYSFTAGHEDGTFRFPPTQPGGGGPTIRRQLRVLRDFVLGFDFVRMKPDTSFVREGVPVGGSARALVYPGRAYALYIRRTAASGAFSARWTGVLMPRVSGEYAFHTSSNDGVRLTRVDPQVDFAFGTNGPLERQVDDRAAPLVVDVPAGSWRATWLDPVSGEVLKEQASTPHAGGAWRLSAPAWTDDVAVAIRRADAP
jgi:PA14 domain